MQFGRPYRTQIDLLGDIVPSLERLGYFQWSLRDSIGIEARNPVNPRWGFWFYYVPDSQGALRDPGLRCETASRFCRTEARHVSRRSADVFFIGDVRLQQGAQRLASKEVP